MGDYDTSRTITNATFGYHNPLHRRRYIILRGTQYFPSRDEGIGAGRKGEGGGGRGVK